MPAAMTMTGEAASARTAAVPVRSLLAGGLGLVGYLAAAIWWGASLDGRVQRLEHELVRAAEVRERIWRRIEGLDTGLTRLDRGVGQVDERTRAIGVQVERIHEMLLAERRRATAEAAR